MKLIDVIREQKCLSLAEIEHDMNLLDIAQFFCAKLKIPLHLFSCEKSA